MYFNEDINSHILQIDGLTIKCLTRQTRQGDLHSFFHADSENQVFDMRFSLRTKKIFH